MPEGLSEAAIGQRPELGSKWEDFDPLAEGTEK